VSGCVSQCGVVCVCVCVRVLLLMDDTVMPCNECARVSVRDNGDTSSLITFKLWHIIIYLITKLIPSQASNSELMLQPV
jgi:hypothetical protein